MFMRTILFFDDSLLAEQTNFKSVICHPKTVSLYRDPYACVHGMACASAIYSPTRKSVLLYYGVYLKGAARNDRSVTVIAESKDGLHFEPLNTEGKVRLSERLCPHQLLDRNLVSEPAVFFEDPNDPDPDGRYKGLTVRHDPNDVLRVYNDLWRSPDGINYKRNAGNGWHPVGAEPIMSCFYNKYRGTYMILVRPDVGERKVYCINTRDWQSFSKPEFVIGADLDDPPLSELYGMPAFVYEDYVVGFPWLFHVNPSERTISKFWKGRIRTCLAYSRDGRVFQRVTHLPFMENGAPGDPGYGCSGIHTMLKNPEGQLVFYSHVREIEHGSTRKENVTGISCSVLRRDGFICLESCAGESVLRTRLLRMGSAPLEINLQCTEQCTCALLDAETRPIAGFSHEECQPFSGDSVSWHPTWKGHACKGGIVAAVELRMISGRIFALRGDFDPLFTDLQYRRYLNDETLPCDRGY